MAWRDFSLIPWKNCVPGGRHGGVALLILPENLVQSRSPGRVGTREIHLRRLARAPGSGTVDLEDQTVLQIAIIRFECGLVASAGEHSSHRWSVAVVLVHWGQAQEHFHGVNRVDRGVEAMLDVRRGRGSRRILADDESDGA